MGVLFRHLPLTITMPAGRQVKSIRPFMHGEQEIPNQLQRQSPSELRLQVVGFHGSRLRSPHLAVLRLRKIGSRLGSWLR